MNFNDPNTEQSERISEAFQKLREALEMTLSPELAYECIVAAQIAIVNTATGQIFP